MAELNVDGVNAFIAQWNGSNDNNKIGYIHASISTWDDPVTAGGALRLILEELYGYYNPNQLIDNVDKIRTNLESGYIKAHIDTLIDLLNTGDIHTRLQAIQDRLDALEPIIARIGLPDNLVAEGTTTLFGLIEKSLQA